MTAVEKVLCELWGPYIVDEMVILFRFYLQLIYDIDTIQYQCRDIVIESCCETQLTIADQGFNFNHSATKNCFPSRS
jgi:hypothetical protein